MQLNVLELFAGTRSIGRAFERAGHKVTSIDWDESFKNVVHRDVYSITLDEMMDYDVIWASPDCTTYSVAAGSRHRTQSAYESYIPKTDYAKYCDKNNTKLFADLRYYGCKKGIYWVENPRGMMRKMPFVAGCPRYTVTYCQYGDFRMKPTDIWTNCPVTWFKPCCKNGDPCHVSSPRGAHKGTCSLPQVDRSRIPDALCDAIVAMSENYYTNH